MFPKVRLRFAPSPTGYLHVGGARTALYNYLYARQQGGDFILRIEDTDEERSTEESLKMVIHDLKWLGLHWDEGPHPETLKDMGPHGPYRQSQRLLIYKEVADQLLKTGQAYYCFLTDEEIAAQKNEATAAGVFHHIRSPYAQWSLRQAQEKLAHGAKAVVRFKTSHLQKDYIFQDIVRGEVKFPSDMVGDFVLLRSDGMPVYNFCCVVDDHLMQISHVLRAEEHLPNTLRQLMIYEAMNWTKPQFGHLSLILDEDKQKMSKRKGATSCYQFSEEGYLPAALKNFIALLGWSHPEGKEVISEEELVRTFSLDRLHPAGAVFDGVKLKWMNSVYLRALPSDELFALVEPFLIKAGLKLPNQKKWQVKSIEAFKTAMETLADAVEMYRPIDDSQFQITLEGEECLKWESSLKVLESWKSQIESHAQEEFTESEFNKIQDEVKNQTGAKGKNLFMPIRVAVIGKPHGTDLKILVPLMSKQSLLNRAQQALGKI